MSHEVAWKKSAENQLAQIWMDAGAHRQLVRAAADRMDANLQSHPYQDSESRWGRTRILIDAPLAVLFEVDDDKKLVDVMKVWRIPVQR
jgi:hypothetical protein